MAKQVDNRKRQQPVDEKQAPIENRVLVDFASVTFAGVTDPLDALGYIGMNGGLFSDMPCGAMGYKKGMRSGMISVFYDGAEGMGVHVSLSGQGCRQYEGHFSQNENVCVWESFVANVAANGGKFTRLDIAIDNVDGQLSIPKLQGAIENGAIKSRFKRARKITGYSLSSSTPQSENGTTLYFGSAQSRLQIRVYDKAEEQQVVCEHWVRCELQLRSERAEMAIRAFRQGKDFATIAVEVINNYVTPINHDDANISRCSVQEWWAAWLGTTEKLKLTTAKAIKYVSEVAAFLKKQYSPTIAMLKKHMGLRFSDYMNELIEEGNKRMSMKHRQILAVSQL